LRAAQRFCSACAKIRKLAPLAGPSRSILNLARDAMPRTDKVVIETSRFGRRKRRLRGRTAANSRTLRLSTLYRIGTFEISLPAVESRVGKRHPKCRCSRHSRGTKRFCWPKTKLHVRRYVRRTWEAQIQWRSLGCLRREVAVSGHVGLYGPLVSPELSGSLQKPFTPSVLLARLRALVDHAQSGVPPLAGA